jgi:SAM-dependent methyltransferase
MNLLREITPEQIQRGESPLAKFVRPMLADEIPQRDAPAAPRATPVAGATDLREHFSKIVASKSWGEGAGFGSDPENVPHYAPMLQNLLRELNVQSVLEVGCGNWSLCCSIDWSGIDYTGLDVIPELIESNAATYGTPNVRFICGDALTVDLPAADLLIVKDVLQHWTPDEVAMFLPRLRQYRYCLVTNDVDAPELMPKWETRWRPVDLTKPPYCLPGELRLVQYLHPYPPKASYLLRC